MPKYILMNVMRRNRCASFGSVTKIVYKILKSLKVFNYFFIETFIRILYYN